MSSQCVFSHGIELGKLEKAAESPKHLPRVCKPTYHHDLEEEQDGDGDMSRWSGHHAAKH